MNSGIKNTLDNSKYFFKICERIILSISKENSSPPEACYRAPNSSCSDKVEPLRGKIGGVILAALFSSKGASTENQPVPILSRFAAPVKEVLQELPLGVQPAVLHETSF
jgi:hypothetical protein